MHCLNLNDRGQQEVDSQWIKWTNAHPDWTISPGRSGSSLWSQEERPWGEHSRAPSTAVPALSGHRRLWWQLWNDWGATTIPSCGLHTTVPSAEVTPWWANSRLSRTPRTWVCNLFEAFDLDEFPVLLLLVPFRVPCGLCSLAMLLSAKPFEAESQYLKVSFCPEFLESYHSIFPETLSILLGYLKISPSPDSVTLGRSLKQSMPSFFPSLRWGKNTGHISHLRQRISWNSNETQIIWTCSKTAECFPNTRCNSYPGLRKDLFCEI